MNQLIDVQDDNKMAYRIEVLSDGILIFASQQDLTDEDGQRMQHDLDFFFATSTSANPLKILFCSDGGRISPAARNAFITLLGDSRIEKLAMLRPNYVEQILADVTTKRSGRNHLRLFQNHSEAIAWLKEENP
jgi:hypothetical protein